MTPTNGSKKEEWGASTMIGASLLVAILPFIVRETMPSAYAAQLVKNPATTVSVLKYN